MLAAEDNLSVVPLDMSDLGEALVTRAALVGFCHTRLNDNTTPTVGVAVLAAHGAGSMSRAFRCCSDAAILLRAQSMWSCA